ncbi:ATP-binding protein [Larkinella rosea]|uniref:ATP-binding protein n=1 Tax=Larkinella rosea TaxID=2025312 RepID=A0A3P1BUZ5_9BACT|nr:ATP-binding protein [Larkinella rosea]RRB04384.1 ATP-binding protein [Larkinella rosea]
MFTRELSSTIRSCLSIFPAVAVLGPRQVGKTTLVKTLLSNYSKEVLYLDLEYFADQRRLQQPDLFFQANQDKLVVLDEIQRMPELFPLLRSMIDQHRIPGRFILLGSASPDLLKNSSETLAGRVIYLELSPLTLGEVSPQYTYREHWLKGGFPDALQAPDPTAWRFWMESFIQTYVQRDLPQLGLSAQPAVIRQLLTMLVSIHSGQLNYSDLSRSLDLTVTTIQQYIGFLENAYLIRRLAPYFVNIGKRLVKAPKIFIRDSGLVHALADISDYNSLTGSILLGASWEGYVIQQIISRLPMNVTPYYYRTQNGAELDLVLVKAGKPMVSVEIRYSNDPSLKRGNTEAISDLQTPFNLVVTPEAEGYWLRKDVKVCSIQSVWVELANAGVLE